MVKIHSTSIVEEGALIGENVVIGPYCIIGKDVKIGDGTIIQSHSVIEGITEIGENNTIYSFVSIGKASQDLKYKGEKTKTIIGNNNTFREFVTIHRGTSDRWETRIGNQNLLMAYVHVAHDVIVGNNCIFSNNATLAGHVVIGNWVIVGGLTPVHQFCKIGDHAMIGGASAVIQDICPYILADGNKAIPVGLNSVGLRRRGFSDEELKILKRAYRTIFRKKIPLKEALTQLEESYKGNKHVENLVEFIKSSSRGISK